MSASHPGRETSSVPLQKLNTSYFRLVFESLVILELFLHYFGLTVHCSGQEPGV